MNIERTLILLVLLAFSVPLFDPLEIAVAGISPSEALKPLFMALPYALIGALMFAFIWLGIMSGGSD
jgi:hypothetical protein